MLSQYARKQEISCVVKEAVALSQEMNLVSAWVEVDTARNLREFSKLIPTVNELSADINENLIVELYSK